MQESSEHTSSYYAATAHWQTDYPLLAGGKWFANPALALGMLYYRLKEIL
jgi:hypothetical protein